MSAPPATPSTGSRSGAGAGTGERLTLTTHDGERLLTELHRPAPGEPIRGSVLIRTPYGLQHQRRIAASLTDRGHLCWLQDTRGKFGSSGVFDPYREEAEDGLWSIRQIRSSPRHQGPLLLLGSSYGATCALEAARLADAEEPAEHLVEGVVAIVPTIGLAETAVGRDGTLRIRDRFGWWHQHAFTATMRRPLPDELLERICATSASRGPGDAAAAWAETLGWSAPQLTAWEAMWAMHPEPLEERFGHCMSPLLVISGTSDFFADRAEDLRHSWGSRTSTQDSSLISGPWGHTLQGRSPDLGRRIAQWMTDRTETTTARRPRETSIR